MIGTNTTTVRADAQRAVQTVRKGQNREEQDAAKVSAQSTAAKFPLPGCRDISLFSFATHFILLFQCSLALLVASD